MTLPQSDITLKLGELATHGFEAFCQDIAEIFGIEMSCTPQGSTTETPKTLEKKFKKLAAVITIKAHGVLGGHFQIVLDKAGLFALAGTVAMLPEQKILSIQKTGFVKDAEELSDAVGEIGNLLIGSWDRIFREELEGHYHFLLAGSFIGDPWADSQKNCGLPGHEKFLFIPYEMTAGSFPSFACGVIFPEKVLQSVPGASAPEIHPPAPTESETPEPVAADLPETACAAESLAKPPADGESIAEAIQKMVQSAPVLPGECVPSLLTLSAKDVMQTQVLWGTPDDNVAQTLAKMQHADAAYMLVGTNGVPEGIVTWIDLAEAVSVYLRPTFAKWRRPSDEATLQIKIKAIMSKPVRTLNPEVSLAVIMKDMCQHRLQCLPIVDPSGAVQGVVTVFDLFKALLNTPQGITPKPTA